MEDDAAVVKVYHLVLSELEDELEDLSVLDNDLTTKEAEGIVQESISFEDVYQQWENNDEFPALLVIEKDGKPIKSTPLYGVIDNIDEEIKRMRESFEEFIKKFKEAFEANGKNSQ